MQTAEVADLHATVREHMLEEPAETLHGVEGGGSSACTAGFTIGDGDATLLERDEAAMGDDDPEDSGGEVWERCGPIWIGLAVDVPRDSPGLWGDVLPPSGVAQVCFAESTGDGGEGFDGDKEVGSGRQPTTSVLRQATAGDNGVDVGVVRELSAPGLQAPEKARAVGAHETLVFGEPFEGLRSGVEHGLGGDALMGADPGAQGLRDSEGEEDVRPRELFVQVVLEPLLGFMRLARWTVPVATGIIDAVFFPTALALREAVSVMATLAMVAGTDGLLVRGGEVGRTLKVLWRKGVEESADGGHGRSPCMRELRRS
jgi:hypothetical protein